jgi:hypothetical protein
VDPTQSPQEETEQNTRFSDLVDDSHIDFVNSQLQCHRLSYMIPFLAQMSNNHSVKAMSIVWLATCSLIIKNSNYSTDQIQIPNL